MCDYGSQSFVIIMFIHFNNLFITLLDEAKLSTQYKINQNMKQNIIKIKLINNI